MTKEIKNIIRMVLSAIIVAFAITGIIHTLTFEDKMHEAFQNGYQQAIEDAELVESNDEGYTLSFNGEVNWYTFD